MFAAYGRLPFWPSFRSPARSGETGAPEPEPRPAPVFIGDAVTPFGGGTLLLALAAPAWDRDSE